MSIWVYSQLNIFRADHLWLNSILGSCPWRRLICLSLHLFISCSSFSRSGILWAFHSSCWHANQCSHYAGLIKVTTLLRFHGSDFPVIFRKFPSKCPGSLTLTILFSCLPQHPLNPRWYVSWGWAPVGQLFFCNRCRFRYNYM